MKKLMVALAVVGMAAVSQAVQFTWSTSTALYAADGKAAQNGGVLYLVDAASADGGISATEFVKAFAEGTSFSSLVSSYSIKSASVGTDGKISSTNWSDPTMPNGTAYAGSTTKDFYTVFLDGDNNLYVSANKSAAIQATAETKLGFALKATSSTGTIFDANDGFKGAGWYSAVPEPTSGLLLLLGVAGLALRRRRA